MTCPKCGNQQTDTVECQACGLVFEKYRQYLARRAQQATRPPAVAPPPATRGRPWPWIVGGAVMLSVVLALLLLRSGRDKVPTAVAAPTPAPVTENLPASPQPRAATGRDLLALLNENAPPGNPIEYARNATVLIRVPWGLGSGFFVRDDCTIVSNRHVVQLDPQQLAAFENEIVQMKGAATTIQTALNNGRARLQGYYDSHPQQSTRDPRAEAYEREIVDNERKLDEFKQKIEAAETELESYRDVWTLQIILADGTELDGYVHQVSSDQDLAIVKIHGDSFCPVIPIGSSQGLHQGDTLYTIGSPMGVRHTVTSGVYSGHIELDGKPMLQTDAPINPGNSGGPLISPDGKVLGVNTLVLSNAQGIGFAIPIEQALQSFALL